MMMVLKMALGINFAAMPIGIIANIAGGGNTILGVTCHALFALGLSMIITAFLTFMPAKPNKPRDRGQPNKRPGEL